MPADKEKQTTCADAPCDLRDVDAKVHRQKPRDESVCRAANACLLVDVLRVADHRVIRDVVALGDLFADQPIDIADCNVRFAAR